MANDKGVIVVSRTINVTVNHFDLHYIGRLFHETNDGRMAIGKSAFPREHRIAFYKPSDRLAVGVFPEP